MKSKMKVLWGVAALLLVIGGGLFLYTSIRPAQSWSDYNPQINPADFSTEISNEYFALPRGKKLVYEATNRGGSERIEIEILKDTKIIEGIETVIYLDREFKNGQLVEETRDYLAQHKSGDVWYFGEDVSNYADGTLKDHSGSFLHGKDGAKAGIWMKAEQRVGDSYRQEYYRGHAEDMRDIVETGLSVSTEMGTFTDCVKVYDWTPLELTSREHKYYCPQVSSLVLVEDLVSGKRTELTDMDLPTTG